MYGDEDFNKLINDFCIKECPLGIEKSEEFLDKNNSAFDAAMDMLENSDLSSVAGLSYRNNGEIISIPEKEYSNTPVSPYTDEYFDKLNGNIGGDLSQFDYVARNADGKAISADTQTYIKVKTTYGTKSKQLQFRSTTDALFAAMYPEYSKWFDDNNIKGSKAESFGAMVS